MNSKLCMFSQQNNFPSIILTKKSFRLWSKNEKKIKLREAKVKTSKTFETLQEGRKYLVYISWDR
jgi:hypothetical protein